MKKIWLTTLLCISVCAYSQQNSDQSFSTSPQRGVDGFAVAIWRTSAFSEEELVRDKVLDYADWRIHPWSLEESLNNVLLPFDYKFVKESSTSYEIKAFEYARRTADFGRDF